MEQQVVVLGAGMVGTATALALQARGFNVVLLDRLAPGSETSYGNAGFIQGEAFEPYALPRDIATLWRIATKIDNSVDWDISGLWRNAPALLSYWRHSSPANHKRISIAYAALIQRAIRDHEDWITASSSSDLVRREGYRLVFRDSAAFEAQARKAEQWRVLYGVNFDQEDSAALAAAEPGLRRPLAGAIRWYDTWTCGDPGALVKAYADLFEQRGGALIQGDLRDLRQAGEGWRITSSAGQMDVENVVVALGPWSARVLDPMGYRVRMIPKRGYHMHFEYPPNDSALRNAPLNLPLIDAAVGAVYAPMRAGLRIATGADLSVRAAKGIPRQLKRAQSAAAELLHFGAPIEALPWNGVRPCMPEMMPVVGAAPHHRGLWFNFGHGHQGFTLGPTTGNLLADIMTGVPAAEALRLSLVRHPQG